MKRIKAVRVGERVFTHPIWTVHSDILTHAIDCLVEEGADRDELIKQLDTREISCAFGYLGRDDEFRTPHYLELMEAANGTQA